MPRRTLVWLIAVVLALHWLVLEGLPLGGAHSGRPESPAFQTRMVEPPPPPPPPAQAAAPEPSPTPPPPSRRAPVRNTPPARPHAPEPPPAAPEEAVVAAEHATSPPADATAQPGPTGEEAANDAVASASAVPDAPAALPAEAPASAASAAAATASPAAQDDNQVSAGVDIRPPGATGNTASGEPPPVRLPAPARLEFEVSGQAKKFQYSAGAELVWRHNGASYEARQEVKAFLIGSRSQTSKGQITAAGLQPERFGDKSRSEQAAHFDFAQGKVVFSANTPQAAIGAGAQDRLSVFIQLGALLAAAPERYPTGTQITLTTVSARNADRWTFTVEGTETLDLPAGPTPALKLQRLPRKDHDQKAELWLGTRLGYLPVRIRLTQSGGDFADLRLSEHSAP